MRETLRSASSCSRSRSLGVSHATPKHGWSCSPHPDELTRCLTVQGRSGYRCCSSTCLFQFALPSTPSLHCIHEMAALSLSANVTQNAWTLSFPKGLPSGQHYWPQLAPPKQALVRLKGASRTSEAQTSRGARKHISSTFWYTSLNAWHGKPEGAEESWNSTVG